MGVELEIRGSGSSWAVYRGEERVSNWQNQFSKACQRAFVLERRMRQSPRACLCCRRTFQSEGPHNRLCDPCRTGETPPW